MGSYDTGEYIPSNYTPPRRETQTRMTEDTPDESKYNPSLPILVALGGGLTPARIVKKLVPPEEFAEKTLVEVVKYMIGPDIATSQEEMTIAEAVKTRMEHSDYRGIVNDIYNFHNEKLKEYTLKEYLITKERQTESGPVKFNYADIAIVSHDEGGRRRLEDTL